MAIKRPDIYEHNNPNLAIVDSDFVRGGGRVVANLTELYALSNKIDQLKERVTKVYVISEEITYVLVNKLDISEGVFNPTAWEESGMSTVYTDGTTITGDGSEENPLVANIPPDYSDMTVDIMLENPTVITSISNGIIVAGFVPINKTIFIRTHSTAIGIYQCVGLYSENAYLQLIAAGTALHTVRVKDGDVWYSQYDGKNAGTLFFERITVEKLAITKQGFNGELSPVVYPVDRQRTVIGYKLGSNATDFSVTINSVNYTKADVTNVVVPVNTEITINDVTIAVGKDTGNVVLILK